MNDMNKDDTSRSATPTPPRTGSDMASAAKPTPPRTGSDTASAANISAGTSVGNAGQPATPYGQQRSAGSSGQSAGSANTARATDAARQAGQTASGVREQVADTVRQAAQTAGGLREQAEGAIDQAADWTREQYRQGARQLYQARNQSMQQWRSAQGGIERFVTENPLMVGVMGLAAGLVIGALLPRTRQEDRTFGRWADEVREQGMRYARDATQRGREYVEEALGGDTDEDEMRPEEGRGSVRSSGPRYQNH